MPITSVEQSAYIAHQQEYLSNLKVGQFAKFLSKNPVYVTYYALNQAMSRTDAGTGNAYEAIGPQSPYRYNKINELPVFNIPEIQPDVVMDEGGYDIESDLSDITFIPGTVRPRPNDCMLIKLPRSKPLLYLCTNFRYNTIQSNDYYLADFSLYDVDQEYIEYIEKQVVEVYTCKFENIGTNNKILLTQEDLDAFENLTGIINTLLDFYKDAFYNEDVDGFVLYNGNMYGTQWYYDNYLTRFINESQIYANEYSDYTLQLPYLELRSPGFDYEYKRTLLYAVLKRSPDYLSRYVYAWNSWVVNRTSPLTLAGIPCAVPNLHIAENYIKPQEQLPDEVARRLNYQPGKLCGWDGMDPQLRNYFSYELVKSIIENYPDEKLNYVEKLIWDYICRGPSYIIPDKKELIERSFKHDLFTFIHMPLVIYILKQVLASKMAKS